MNGLHRTLIAVLALILIGTTFLPAPAEAGVTVADEELVSKKRVGRAIELSYRLTVDNVGTSLDGVKVYVSCDAAGTTMVDDVVDFGDIPENAATTSVDTFTIRLNRRVANVPSCLSYVIGFNTIVKLSGTATDMPLSEATIIGTIVTPDSGRPIIDSGRPIIDTVIVTADADGNYEMELQAVTEDDFITLEAQGTGDQEGAVLTSSVGSVGSLQEVGESGSIIVGSGDAGALNITHITTAQDELVRRLNGGVAPQSDAELAALQAQVDGAELLVLATVIKTIVDNTNIPLPQGFNSTLELIQDEEAANQAAEDLAATPEFQEALVTTAETLGLGYDVDEVIGRLYAVKPTELPLDGSAAYIFDFDANGGGNVTFFSGSTPITWLINPDGDIEATPSAPFLLFESFPALPECANNPGGQCRTLTFLEGIRIVRLANGIETDQVFVLQTTRTTYPDDPIPDVVAEDLPDPNLVYLSFGEDGIIPVEPADIAGSKIAAYYYHQDNESVGLNDPVLGADFLTFNGDGTGGTERRGFDFSWSIDASGAVVVDFPNGDSNRYILYDDSDIAQAIVVGSLATGESFTAAREIVDSDGTVFTDANVANRRYRGLFSIVDDVGFLFDFVYLPDGTGCRLQVQPLTWETTPDNLLDTFLFSDFEPDVAFQRRAWEVIRVEPGILGDRYWVIEMLDTGNFARDPNYIYADPATTPGRINTYEFVEDLTGQFDPCGQGASNSLPTLDPFSSNNGGVGNMFDVTTLDGAVEITSFDLNVDFAQGVPFEFAVYTLPGGFQNGIIADGVDVGAWTQIFAGNGTAAGRDQPSPVGVDPFVLDGATTTGFWITLARDGSVTTALRDTGPATPLIAAFEFENAAPGTSVAPASATGANISGTAFGGSKFDSQVIDFSGSGGSNVYRSAPLFAETSGGNYNYLSFTTSEPVSLDVLRFTAGQNDCFPCSNPLTPLGPRSFDILISPVNVPTPTGLRDAALTGYSLLETVAVPYGFALEADPNFEIDLSNVVLVPGTYHIAFAAAPSNGIVTNTTQLFMDHVELTRIPEPTIVENADIRIDLGAGVAAPSPTTGTEAVTIDRIWNGRVYYNTR